MSGVTFVDSASGGGSQGVSTTTGSLTWPATIAANDFALLWLASTSGTFNTPSGFSLHESATGITGNVSILFTKKLTGSETGSLSWSINSSSNANPIGLMTIFRGVDTTTPILVDAATATSTTASTTIVTTSVTNTSTDAALVAFFSGGVTGSTTTSTWTEAASVGSAIEPTNGDIERHSTANTMSGASCYVLNASASATTVTGTRSVTSSAKAAYLGFLNPAPQPKGLPQSLIVQQQAWMTSTW